MKPSLEKKLMALVERFQEVSALLGEPEIISDQNKFRDLSKEFSQLEPIIVCYKKYTKITEAVNSANELLKDPDQEMQALAKEELLIAQAEKEITEEALLRLLLPRDPNDDKNIFLEVRAGTGGDEAALFAGDLFRMYSRYAEQKKWQLEIISQHLSEQGGYKEIIAKISGQGIYGKLKFESGAHRVQRVPATESQGRVHTSACTVAVMPEMDELEAVEINAADLRVDTFRASGAGGQHVNKTDSAIRITHIPTGIVVECQDERSQHKNRARAMSLLQSRLFDQQQSKQQSEQAETRRNLVGSGDRSERIRTYNFPQGRLTDHRINLTLYKLEEIIEGNMEEVITALEHENQADLLAAMGDE